MGFGRNDKTKGWESKDLLIGLAFFFYSFFS